jgi:predicted phosphodiesterase
VKLAILSDLHGNCFALRATLRAARAAGAEHLIVLGDFIGYYYWPAETLAALRDWPMTAISGNHERLYAASLESADAAANYRRACGSALDVARDTLAADETAWLLALPARDSATFDGITFELCHGSPRDPDEYVYPDAAASALDACAVPSRHFVLMGHTHRSMVVPRASSILVNPGSVGQARDVGGAASWCVFDTATGVLQFQRTPYDVAPVVAAARRIDPALPDLASVLTRGMPDAVAELVAVQ